MSALSRNPRPLLTRPSTLYRVTYRQVCFKCFNSHWVPFANDGYCARQLSIRPSVLMHRKGSIKRFNAPAGDTFQAISLAGGHVISNNYYYFRKNTVFTTTNMSQKRMTISVLCHSKLFYILQNRICCH